MSASGEGTASDRRAEALRPAGAVRARGGALRSGAACALAVALSAPAVAGASSLAAHRAVYEITLDAASAGTGVAELTGRMVYELAGSDCEGWTQNMRFVTRSTGGDGAAQLNDLRTSSWEDVGGDKLRFSVTQYRDGRVAEATQGDATREADGAEVALTKPVAKQVKLPGRIYFPIRHSLALLDAARAGKTSFTADLYDGSDKGEKVNHTIALIGRKFAPGTVKSPASLKNGDKLDSLPAWPFAISYFDNPGKSVDAAPSYELAFRFYENGVSTKLHINYGEFAINGELSELTFLDAGKCKE